MSTILPLNMVLQIILVPVYLLLMFGADVHVDSYESVVLALCTLVIPMLAVLMVRRLSTSSGKTRTLQSVSEENASLGQLLFLCIAVFLMFLSCSSEIIVAVFVLSVDTRLCED